MSTKKVLFITQEIAPYLPDSEIALTSRHLPQGIQDQGREIRTFMPRYGCINERRNQLHEVIRLSGLNLIIDDTDHPLIIKVATLQPARMQVYFIDNEDFFHRKNIVADDEGAEYEDNDERAIFFVRGVFETIKKLRWIPDVIHCHGWLTALTPLYLKRIYRDELCFSDTKVVYSIYDDSFKNPLRKEFAKKLMQDGATHKDVHHVAKQPDHLALTKLAVQFADGVIQGAPQLDDDVQQFITQLEKPFLPYQSRDVYIKNYNDFYNSLIGTNE
ncbi:MAG: glycogen/starch synthase [Tannerella sp.]|jgi:starch synthase|nr:glycogen/starch synthase [Tannerella sp.]